MRVAALQLVLFLYALARASASPLPQHIDPAPPFPAILSDAPTISFVAPGVTYGDYQMWTAVGSLAVHVVSVDLRNPMVRVGTVLGSNRLIAGDETASSMADRTGAVAGINGDYFDINGTGQPLNILVHNGALVRAPMQRYALGITTAGAAEFAEFSFNGTLLLPGGATAQLDGLNQWPPPGGGTSLLTPTFGDVAPVENLTLVSLQPLGNVPPFGSYRVTGIADNTSTQPPGYYLGIGLNAYGSIGVPNAGDTIVAQGTLTPPLDDLVSAIGGGPLLLKDGNPFDDPDGPSSGAFRLPIPCTGAADTAGGALLLFEVDGRQPNLSVGITRPQFAALMLAFGAVDGMAFDGGGSSTIVTRRLGDAEATVRNSPSDGKERPVADGLFVYSDAPQGPPARVAVDPQAVRAAPGARVALHFAVTDAAGHPLAAPAPFAARVVPGDLGAIDDGTFVASSHAGDGIVEVRSGAIVTNVPVHVVSGPARIVLLPHEPNVRAGERVAFRAQAFDADGYPIALPARVRWSSSGGTIDANGIFTAGKHDGAVTVRIGGITASERVTVGAHTQRLPCPFCGPLRYDFSTGTRAAYLRGSIDLPAGTRGVTFEVDGDGNGEVLRVALLNAIDERFALGAVRVDWTGWRTIAIAVPDSLAQPARLRAIYVVSRWGSAAVTASGTVAVRNLRAVVAGQ